MNGPAARPVVAVTGRHLAAGRVEHWRDAAVASPAGYLSAVTRAGGIPVVLEPTEIDDASAATLLGRVDALVLTGGIDVDPARYGQEPAPRTYGCHPLTDRFEEAMVRSAERSGLPLLAICRGLQVLNVAHGGTLDQHITDRPGLVSHGRPNGGVASPVAVSVEPGSLLGDALGTDRVTGSCHHHQAVDRTGTGLRVVARAGDGVVEGLEPVDAVDGWVVAVQWHPEDTAATDPSQQRLFDALVTQATLRSRKAEQPMG